MKDYHLILAACQLHVRRGADHAGAISAALADRRYTYGHPADYLRVALRLDAHLRAWASRPPDLPPAIAPRGFRMPRVAQAIAPSGLDDAGRRAIRATVYADRAVSRAMPVIAVAAPAAEPRSSWRRAATPDQLERIGRRFPGAAAAIRRTEVRPAR